MSQNKTIYIFFCCRFCFTLYRDAVGLYVDLLERCRRIRAEFTIQIWNENGEKIKEDEFKYDYNRKIQLRADKSRTL